jgi:hypothetical protein
MNNKTPSHISPERWRNRFTGSNLVFTTLPAAILETLNTLRRGKLSPTEAEIRLIRLGYPKRTAQLLVRENSGPATDAPAVENK